MINLSPLSGFVRQALFKVETAASVRTGSSLRPSESPSWLCLCKAPANEMSGIFYELNDLISCVNDLEL